MGLPSCCCCYRQCASGSFSYFGEAVLIHLFFVRFLILFFVVISSSIALETMFRGMLPTLLQLFPKTTCFIPTSCTHTHTRTAEVCRPTYLIPALSHPYCTYSETQLLTHSNPTHPLIPPSFFRFPLAWLNLAIAARIHPQQRMVSLKTCTITTTLSPPLSLLLAGLQHMKRTKKCEDNLIQEASRLSDPGAAGHAPNLNLNTFTSEASSQASHPLV